MEGTAKVTAKQVAAAAGVSTATVSMILNNYENVHFSEETRKRVLAACKELGYQKLHFHNNLQQSSQLLIAICPSYQNLHYIKLIGAMQERAKELGYSLLAFSTSRDPVEESKVMGLCAQLPFAGTLFLYQPENPAALQYLSLKKPTVHVNDRNPNLNVDILELNSHKLGRIVGKHLLQLGHEQIAFITTPLAPNQLPRLRRVEGLREVFREKGRDPDRCVQVYTADTEHIQVKKRLTEYETGYLIAGRLVDREEPVTAMAGMNDMVALGIMDAILERGKRIPQDYSVCGCDNIQVGQYQRISLTTVEHYAEQKGREAVDILVKKIEQEPAYSSVVDSPISVTRVEYSPKLIVRGSTGRCK